MKMQTSNYQYHHLLLLLIIQLLVISTVIAAADDVDDSAAILKIASGFDNVPEGWSSTSSKNYCNWPGLSCGRANRINYISLASKSLSGTLAPEIANLSELRGVSLQRNSLTGNIPSFGNLVNLENLFLDFNNFTSITPDAFAGLSSIQTLSIGVNPNLSPWTFPNVSELTSLVRLDLDNTNMYGTLPDIFRSLGSLQKLGLSYNNLNGTLPASLGGSMIQIFWINNQNTGFGFTGTLDVLSNMTELTQAWVHMNSFTGPIPDLSKCNELFDLQIRDNQLTGPVPASLYKLPSLKSVSLDNNKLQGPFPRFPKTVSTVVTKGNNDFCNNDGAPCDSTVSTLIEIAGGFGYPILLADNWQGNDACQMSFVTCDNAMNVITVNLANKGLSGKISPAFGDLKALKILKLNDNNLTGPIPDSLTMLSDLELFDVSNNNLSGDIPKFGSAVNFVKSGNPLLGKPGGSDGGSPVPLPGGSGGGSPGPQGSDEGSSGSGSGDQGTGKGVKGKKSMALIICLAVGALSFLAIFCFILYKHVLKKKARKFSIMKKKKKKKKNHDAEKGELKDVTMSVGSENNSESQSQKSDHHLFDGGNVVISIEVLRQVTDNFSESNILGKGGFGVVYKGELHDGTQIAVKRMEYSIEKGTRCMDEFEAEISLLSKVRHRHLVALLGYCINGNERLLVYEYMPMGTLSQHLFRLRDGDGGSSTLTWKQRLTIALDVARGVEYLHSLALQSFIHRDLKPSNILLGGDMRAKVADFGLVKSTPDGIQSLHTRLAGTFGYLAPEYATTGRVTTKVDVYAFGIVLMEIITGRKALDETLPDGESHLVYWFRRVLINKDEIPKIVDETIKCNEDNDANGETMASIYKVAELAGHCTSREPSHRPEMGHAVSVLCPLVKQWKPTREEVVESAGIDFDLSLSEALQKWQASEGTSSKFSDTMINTKGYGTQTSISGRASELRDTLTSCDHTP